MVTLSNSFCLQLLTWVWYKRWFHVSSAKTATFNLVGKWEEFAFLRNDWKTIDLNSLVKNDLLWCRCFHCDWLRKTSGFLPIQVFVFFTSSPPLTWNETSRLTLRWMRDSPQTGCGRRINAYMSGVNKRQQSDLVRWSLLLLAATVRSFGHLSLGL